MQPKPRTPAEDAREIQRLIDASIYESIPAGEATVIDGAFGALLWRVESGFDLPPEFADTVPTMPGAL